MSESQPSYRLDHVQTATEQIRSIAALARKAGKLPRFTEILKKAVELLCANPHGWGDPLYRLGLGDAIVCHSILRPIIFRYVIYEEIRALVLLDVELFTVF